MPRNGKGTLISAVKRLFTRGRVLDDSAVVEPRPPAAESSRRSTAAQAAKPVKREADIPLDVLDSVYTPPVTSSKASFRSDGADHQRDQELVPGTVSEWNDEDRYTNKSGDPRIGTHRRTYEPDEARAEQE
jgi:hypothetical protein